MFGFWRRKRRDDVITRFHAGIVDASRRPALYGEEGFPDTLDGRFESLTLHVLLMLRRLRHLPDPAAEVAQELVDAVFAHLEVAMRESGIGDVGVPKRMKKLGGAFYERTAKYEATLEARDREAFAQELGRRLALPDATAAGLARYVFEAEESLAGHSLDALMAGQGFPEPRLAPEAPLGVAEQGGN